MFFMYKSWTIPEVVFIYLYFIIDKKNIKSEKITNLVWRINRLKWEIH